MTLDGRSIKTLKIFLFVPKEGQMISLGNCNYVYYYLPPSELASSSYRANHLLLPSMHLLQQCETGQLNPVIIPSCKKSHGTLKSH